MRHTVVIGMIPVLGIGLTLLVGWSGVSLIGHGLLLLVWAGSVASVYYLLAGSSVLAIFVRAILALFPIGGVTAVLIYVVLTYVDLSEDSKRAVVAAIVVAAGWVVAFVTTEWRMATDEQERRRDVIRAALTEVELIVRLAQDVDWAARRRDIAEAFFRDRRYAVFVMYGDQFETLRRLAAQIEILNRAQIRPVLEFYQILSRLAQIEENISSTSFASLSPERREAIVLHYIEMRSAVPEIGGRARDALGTGPFHGLLRRLK